ncbi:MAG: Rieske 2Fe-2S domain-containing protein [Oligoflexia bacterium]|nr:Rieske 2Fe-2S domain-containing protein [Oligoflexia bacterium]
MAAIGISKRVNWTAAFFGTLLICSLILAGGCRERIQTRPIGWMHLGLLKDLLAEETYMPEKRLLLRRDAGGFYIMSTECTYDLARLVRRPGGDGYIFVSPYNGSEYDYQGKVLKGPAVANLPYYVLRLDSSTYGGPKDTLFVQIGVEKPVDWRLKAELPPENPGATAP